MTQEQALNLLRQALNDPNAQFRDGQWEAIDALVNTRQKLLVVQRTGWGKSLVYFISAKGFRDNGMGPTIIISPLVALMRNQIEAAQHLGIVVETINYTNNREHRQQVQQRMQNNEIDCLLISPERLADDDFINNTLLAADDSIAMMVVDEAHCISDWGHDFRPDYQRIANILKPLPKTAPVLCTTATANQRVVRDIQKQLGNFNILRGPLIRTNLALQTMECKDKAFRLA